MERERCQKLSFAGRCLASLNGKHHVGLLVEYNTPFHGLGGTDTFALG
ncbi:MAG: hypothetical protein M2R45_01567 [Verrucomicrobia subdivision 3 bacterium]|nr:hypothetical protein [Limisphaerales bacterium]MCS1413306.1 hypothetical protein [Limisphaerales bacterium]